MNKDYYEQTGVAMTCRSYKEYGLMFDCELAGGEDAVILDVAGGASSFAAELRSRGMKAVSADPLYKLSVADMEAHGLRELEEAEGKLRNLQPLFDWSYYGSADGHEKLRREALKLFLNDYRLLKESGVYVPASLPNLPFPDGTFSHVFCSHFLFLYAEQLSYDFHLEAILELARVCKPGGAVRIYPLQDLRWRPYPKLEQLIEDLAANGLQPKLAPSKLPFIPDSNRYLFILKKEKDCK